MSLVMNLIGALLALASWLQGVAGVTDERRLVARGVGSLRYFTVLSNLLAGLVSAIVAATMLTGTAAGQLPAWLCALRLVAATAVALTAIVVVLLLAPRLGWQAMYGGSNFWMHLVLPILHICDCVLMRGVGALPLAATIATVLPTLVYGLAYLARVRRQGPAADFYGFLRWGEERIGVVMAGMLLFTWAIGIVLWLASRLVGTA